MVKTSSFQCRSVGLIPGQSTDSRATWHGQKINKKFLKNPPIAYSQPSGFKIPPPYMQIQLDSTISYMEICIYTIHISTYTDCAVLCCLLGFPDSSVGKESACNAGDPSLIPGSGRSPGEGKRYPLQYSGLENSMDCIVHGVAKSQTRLRDFHFQFHGVYYRKTSICQWTCSVQTELVKSQLYTVHKFGNQDSKRLKYLTPGHITLKRPL